jgi:hypothetical protein
VRNSSGHFVDCVDADGVRTCRFFAISKSGCGIWRSVDCQIALARTALEQPRADAEAERARADALTNASARLVKEAQGVRRVRRSGEWERTWEEEPRTTKTTTSSACVPRKCGSMHV